MLSFDNCDNCKSDHLHTPQLISSPTQHHSDHHRWYVQYMYLVSGRSSPKPVWTQVVPALLYILRYKLANLNVKQKVCSE
jgi:hypothetical protein